MADTPETLADLEVPIANALMMAGVMSELLEAVIGSDNPEMLVLGTYHALTPEEADRLLWVAFDVVSRMKQLRADWDAANSAHCAAVKEAAQ